MEKINLLKKTILILIIFVLLIILIINIIQINNAISKKAIQEEEYSKSEQFILDDISKDLVRPQFSGLVLMKYKGSSSQEEIIKDFCELETKVIPTYYEIFNKKDESIIKKYYNITENKEYAKRKLGITSYDDFLKMQYNIQKLKGEKLKFESYKFIKDSVEEVEEGVKAKLEIVYQNNEELQFDVLVKNNIQEEESLLIIL